MVVLGHGAARRIAPQASTSRGGGGDMVDEAWEGLERWDACVGHGEDMDVVLLDVGGSSSDKDEEEMGGKKERTTKWGGGRRRG